MSARTSYVTYGSLEQLDYFLDMEIGQLSQEEQVNLLGSALLNVVRRLRMVESNGK